MADERDRVGTPARDVDRTAVYAAELAAFDATDLESVRPVARIVAAIEDVVAGEWWPGPNVDVRPARSDARSSSTRVECATGSVSGGGNTDIPVEIRIARPQATIATAAHELAHALAGVDAGHGPLFRRAHLDAVGAITNRSADHARGPLHVDQLRDAYAAAGLPIADRRWPAPPQISDSAPIVL